MKSRFAAPLAGLLGFGLLLLSLTPAAAQLFETKAAQAFM
ncbi:MAG: D-alanyl-D-alanine carboxypeptidase, partial [Mesorhizobium sp.]